MKMIACEKCAGKGKVPDPQERADDLHTRLKQSGFSLRTVADKMGITAPYLLDLVRGNRKLNDQLIARFVRALKELESIQKETVEQ